MIRTGISAFLVTLGMQAGAFELPASSRAVSDQTTSDSYAAPIGAYDGEKVPVARINGTVQRQSWRIPGTDSGFQFVDDIASSLESAGYSQVLDCRSRECGGFDFRFNIEVLPAPEMYVNLRNFRFATFVKGKPAQPESAVTVLASSTPTGVFLQVITVSAGGETSPVVAPKPDATDGAVTPTPAVDVNVPPGQTLPLSEALLQKGWYVLEGLVFETGATRLGPGPFKVLSELSDFLVVNPEAQIALVGHTDSVGSLDNNRRISTERAQSVRQRLAETYGVEVGRIDAQGASYLSPRGSNLTEDGRALNRRVEVIILKN